MRQLTSNQRYGGLNRRFDKRSRLLLRLGFKYVTLAPVGADPKRGAIAGAFYRNNNWRSREGLIPAAAVAHAAKEVWFDILRLNLAA